MDGHVPDLKDIGARVQMAREDARMTQAELALLLGLDRTAVAKIESGSRKIAAIELVRIASTLDRPIDWFVAESPPAVVSRRLDPITGGFSKILDRQIERLARDVEFLEGDGILPPNELENLEFPKDVVEAEQRARTVRASMSAPKGPLKDLQRHAESIGLLAFSQNLGDEEGDAAYVAVDRCGVALINGSVDPGRRRFNLAHEVGHHVFADAYAPEVHISPVGDSERLINAFAIHLLLPREEVSELWQSFDDKRMAAVAIGIQYRVSWSAVCAQLKNIGLISESLRSELMAVSPTRADSIELGERWVNELEAPSVPPNYGRRILGAYRNGRLSSSRTIELLWGTVREEELPERNEVPLEGFRREFNAYS